MQFPKIIIEGNEKYYILIAVGILMVFIIINIGLRTLINNKKKKSIISQQKLLVLKNQRVKLEFTKKIQLQSKCPDEQAGNPNAFLTIKYFYSPVCFWCILEDKHFDELLSSVGYAFKLEKYSRENCDSEMQKYKLNLTPSFVFSTRNDSQEYTVDGYITKENLSKVICDVTGYCVKENGKKQNEPQGQKIKINFQ